MSIKFTKMHGIGNDYIFIDCFAENLKNIDLKDLAIRMSDRHFGIGSDGIILIMPAESKENDFRYRIFNSDGSEAEMCGNGIRCAAKYVFEHGLTKKTNLRFETKAGIIKPEIVVEKSSVKDVRVDMGEPVLERGRIPMIGQKGTVVNKELKLEGRSIKVTCVSMGNPHCVILVEDTEFKGFDELGKKIENHKAFPNRTNVEFVKIMNQKEIKMRVWERGAGETLACGTGACASVIACVLNKKTERNVIVHLKGGNIQVEWDEKTNHVFKTGPAVEVFEGVWAQS
ncbi:MAG TPA: diaminopimelate epimerase [Candidatus Methanoperedens sp.]